MIELSPNTAFLIYLGLTLTTILALWIVSHYRTYKRQFLPLEQELNICEFCHYAYLDRGDKKITKCPCCDSFNRLGSAHE